MVRFLVIGVGCLIFSCSLRGSTMSITSIVPAPNGLNPRAPLLLGKDGNLYGTTTEGGAYARCGTIFRITPSGTLTTLVQFNGANGDVSVGPLLQGRDGNFYGTTTGGGSNFYGTVFKLTPSGKFTTLASFNVYNCSPMGTLAQDAQGNIYGASAGNYGPNEDYSQPETGGSVFKVSPTGVVTTLYSFSIFASGFQYGNHPQGGVTMGNDGNLYGTTPYGGTGGNGKYPDGTLFKITPAGVLTTLVSFNYYGNGAAPFNPLIKDANGNFYGTTNEGGPKSSSSSPATGTIFEATPTGSLTTLYTFSHNHPNCELMLDPAGNLYGTTTLGGTANEGTAFKLSAGGTLNTLFNFNAASGIQPSGGLVEDASGNLYGTTFNLGSAPGTMFRGNNGASTPAAPYAEGGVFKLAPGGMFTELATFFENGGANPDARLLQASDGNFYGTTTNGTLSSPMGTPSTAGTVFRYAPNSGVTPLAVFDATTGSFPEAALIQGSDGNLYGTTFGLNVFAGSYPGSVYKLTLGGVLSPVYVSTSFSSTAELIEGAPDVFYGTFQGNPAATDGGVFQVSSSGAFSTVGIFPEDSSQGSFPVAGLIFGSDGNLYGTAEDGGPSDSGSIFRISPSAQDESITALGFFSATSGGNPNSTLVPGPDGDFYGTTYQGNSFEFTPDQPTATPVPVGPLNGSGADSGLLASGGNFYGTNENSILEITPAGVVTTLYTFFTADGDPVKPSGLIQGTDGAFYGTTYSGGTTGSYGSVFRFNSTSTESFTFASASTVPIASPSYTISGSALSVTLDFVPATGTVLTVINTTGNVPIQGVFTNLPDGGTIQIPYQGTEYTFRASYHGGASQMNLTLTLQP